MMKAVVAIMIVAVVATSFADVDDVVPESFTQLSLSASKACGMNVKKCFAPVKKTKAPVYQKPAESFSASYGSMCAPEQKTKVAAKEQKEKARAKTKELCGKNEANEKLAEKKIGTAKGEEVTTKKDMEIKLKAMEKKVKGAKEATIKTAKVVSTIKSSKSNEVSNKAEDAAFKKEQESDYKQYQKMRELVQKSHTVVYVPTAEPVPAPAPAPVKKVVKVVEKPVVEKKPVVKKKPVVEKPVVEKKPIVKTIVKTIVKKQKQKKTHISEALIKNGEVTQKATEKSAEVVNKAELKGKEAVTKESSTKGETKNYNENQAKLDITKAHAAKLANEGAEMKSKAEIKVKVAVEAATKTVAKKELAAKKIQPVKVEAHPASLQTNLEVFVKGCKTKEEKFAKASAKDEGENKELKKKVDLKPKMECASTKEICQEIFAASTTREEELATMVAEHDEALQEALTKAENSEAKVAAKLKFDICKSAADDMKYFSKKFLFGTSR